MAEELRSEPLPLVIVGDGAVLCEKALTESGLPCRLAPPQLVMQNAMSVALCAEDLARAGKLVSAQELLPVYLRPPQAQRLRQAPPNRGEGCGVGVSFTSRISEKRSL